MILSDTAPTKKIIELARNFNLKFELAFSKREKGEIFSVFIIAEEHNI